MTVQVLEDREALARAIAHRLTERVEELSELLARPPRVVLTGGTIATGAYGMLGGTPELWQGTDFYWGDERWVPAGHPDRNDEQARNAFLRWFEVPEERIHAMPAADDGLSKDEAARQYAETLPQHLDLLLLGVGPDGHVASLFPGSPLLSVTDRAVVGVDESPKPPAERLSLTFPALCRAETVWFVVAGQDKAAAVAAALTDAPVEEIPAVGVSGRSETVWLLDVDAAEHLPR